MTFHSTKPMIPDAAAAAPKFVPGSAVQSPLQSFHAVDLGDTGRTLNSRGRVLFTIAELRGVPVESIKPSDPLIP